jgi:hypothetical protein
MSAPDISLINAFFINKWGSATCEICGHRAWMWAASDDFPYLGISAINRFDQITGPFWGALGIHCGNCGNLKFISLNIIQGWLNAEEGKKAVAEFVALSHNSRDSKV